MSVFTLYQTYELRTLVRVHRTSGLLVKGAVHGLSTHDLRGRGNQRRQTCSQTHRGDKLHGTGKNILRLKLLELSHHVRIHTARDLGLLHQLVGSGETEVGLDLLACGEQLLEVLALCSLDGLVEQGVHLGGKGILHGVESLGCGLLGTEYRQLQLLAYALELGVYLRHGIHVHTDIDTHLLAEDIDELQSRRSGALAEPPAVGIHDVDAGGDGGKYRSQTVTRSTVRVEVDRHIDILLEQLYQTADALGRNQTRHILDGDHVGTQSRHLLGLVEEILIREDRLRRTLSEQTLKERGLRILRVDRITYGAVGDAAVLLHILDRRLDVVHVVQRIEDTHDAESALDGITAEAVDDLVRIGRISEQVAAARQSRQLRHVAHSLVYRLKTGPRVLTQISHYRIGHRTAPNLHGIETGILVVGQTAVYLLLRHTGSE